jgi:hypothetical protein
MHNPFLFSPSTHKIDQRTLVPHPNNPEVQHSTSSKVSNTQSARCHPIISHSRPFLAHHRPSETLADVPNNASSILRRESDHQ